MLQNLKLKELSFIVYGLGLSGRSVVNFFKKRNIKNFKVWDDKNKRIFRKHRAKNLRKSLSQVDYIILSPGIKPALYAGFSGWIAKTSIPGSGSYGIPTVLKFTIRIV